MAFSHLHYIQCPFHPVRMEYFTIVQFLGAEKRRFSINRADHLYGPTVTGSKFNIRFRKFSLTINVPVVYMARDVMILMGENPFRWPTPSNGPSNGYAPITIIKSKRHIKNRYIGNFMCTSFATCVFCILYSVFCILYSVLYVVSFMWFSGPTPSEGKRR